MVVIYTVSVWPLQEEVLVMQNHLAVHILHKDPERLKAHTQTFLQLCSSLAKNLIVAHYNLSRCVPLKKSGSIFGKGGMEWG